MLSCKFLLHHYQEYMDVQRFAIAATLSMLVTNKTCQLPHFTVLVLAPVCFAKCCCRIFLHHYQEYMDVQGFDDAAECLHSLADDYRAADAARPTQLPSIWPKGLTFL
jgi:hypothetical protein